MKFDEIKNKSPKELQELLTNTRGELGEARFKASERQLKNVRKIRTLRRMIARILTLLNGQTTISR